MSKKLFIVCGLALAGAALVGCGQKDPVETVRARATERWQLVSKHELVKAYDYLSPGYRATHTLEQYIAFIATARVHWKSADVENVTCQDDVCEVKLSLVSSVPGPLIGRPTDLDLRAPLSEKWIRSDGQWYFLPNAKIDATKMAEQSDAAKATALPLQPVPSAANANAPAANPAANPPAAGPVATAPADTSQKDAGKQ